MKNGNAHMVFTMYDQNGEEHVFSFDRINEKYESVEEGDVSFDVDATSDTSGEITITNEKFVRNLWLYSDTQGVRFDRNFESLLPGTHVIKYWSTEKVDPNGFNTIYLD